MSKRAHYFMVPEDDAAWCRFWAAYPKRVSKKDARKAWAELNPSPETVEKIVEALTWQSQQPMWVKDGGQFVPYPASWIRGERFDDEAPQSQRMQPDRYGHIPPCRNFVECRDKVLAEGRSKLRSA